MFVRNWMSQPAISVEPTVLAREALERMEIRKVRRLPVVEGNHVVGIVTRSDLYTALGVTRRRGRDKTVADIMAREVATVPPDETLEGASQIMLKRKISGLPVVENGALVGIITESDLFRALCGILGIGDPSARIVFPVAKGENLLEKIAERTRGMELRSMATYHNLIQDSWEVALRVRSERG